MNCFTLKSKRRFCIGSVALVLIACWGRSNGAEVLRSSALEARLADGTEFAFFMTAKPVDGPLFSYGKDDQWVVSDCIEMRSVDGKKEVIYQPLSYPAQSAGLSDPFGSLTALRRETKLEIMRGHRGCFDLFRFEMIDRHWKFEGAVFMHDFDGINLEPDMADAVELVDFGKVKLHIRDGSTRWLTIDQEGVVRENGIVYEFKRVVKDPSLSQIEHYRQSYAGSAADYYAPRDVNGVMLRLPPPTPSSSAGRAKPPVAAESGASASPRPPVASPKPATAPANRPSTAAHGRSVFIVWIVTACAAIGLLWYWLRGQR